MYLVLSKTSGFLPWSSPQWHCSASGEVSSKQDATPRDSPHICNIELLAEVLCYAGDVIGDMEGSVTDLVLSAADLVGGESFVANAHDNGATVEAREAGTLALEVRQLSRHFHPLSRRCQQPDLVKGRIVNS